MDCLVLSTPSFIPHSFIPIYPSLFLVPYYYYYYVCLFVKSDVYSFTTFFTTFEQCQSRDTHYHENNEKMRMRIQLD